MTLTVPPPSPPALDATAPAPDATPPRGTAQPRRRNRGSAGRAVAVTMALAAGLLLGFAVYLLALSGVSEAHAQNNLRNELRRELAQATAPVGPTGEGRPVALLDIPALDIRTLAVVEGTSSRDLMAGPGHLPSSPLPGQAGTSVLFGKRSTFGAPFARLLRLKIGDRIVATTGQGRAVYVVSSFGDTRHPAPANSANTLRLVTAEGQWSTSGSVVVSADLTTPVQDAPGGRPPVIERWQPMTNDPGGSLVPLAGWSQLLLLTAVVGTWLLHRGPRWPVVLCVGPITLAVLWNVYENAAGLLPNLL